jgi:hypothetical protein
LARHGPLSDADSKVAIATKQDLLVLRQDAVLLGFAYFFATHVR